MKLVSVHAHRRGINYLCFIPSARDGRPKCGKCRRGNITYLRPKRCRVCRAHIFALWRDGERLFWRTSYKPHSPCTDQERP